MTRQGESLNKDRIHRIISCLGKKAGLTNKNALAPHAFAILYVKRGGSPFVLQRLLGHSDMKTVMIYVNLVGKDLREDYFRHSPLDKLG